jgi:hypothetical protein
MPSTEDSLAPADSPLPAAQAAGRFPDHLRLREAIALHHRSLGELQVSPGDETSETARLFAGHDACHALFDCATDLRGETQADVWTLAATTMTFRRYQAYLRQPEVTALLRSISWWRAVGLVPWMLADTVRIWWRSRGTPRWDFDAWEDHADETLGALRRRHGLRPL